LRSPYSAGLLDEHGDPTTDASAAKKGDIAPFGGPEGYGLGIAPKVLVASLAESAVGTDVKGTLDSINVSNKGDLFIVIAPPHADEARAMVTDYLDLVRAAAPADPAHRVLAPSDRARAARAQSTKRGVFIDDGLWADSQKLAAESQIQFRKEKAT
jgi:LDH2 family malate/lactate/ureidoglycolate dehydrogenase